MNSEFSVDSSLAERLPVVSEVDLLVGGPLLLFYFVFSRT